MSRRYHNVDIFKGESVGQIIICDIRIRKRHGKTKLIALWRYPAGAYRMHESEVSITGNTAYMFAGSEHRLFIIPNRLIRKAGRSIA